MTVRKRSRDDRDASPSRPPAARFRTLDEYRAQREWRRYEGTAQRDLYRQLRERFLARHSVDRGWAIDVGSGPGRFTPWVGNEGARRVALDVSWEMLRLLPKAWRASGAPGPAPDRVRADGAHPPFAPGVAVEVVALGNALGFAVSEADLLLGQTMELVASGGTLVVEVSPAAGERSRYLARLPESSVARLLRSPVPAVRKLLDREGFRYETARHDSSRTFRRLSVDELRARLERTGWEIRETLAVAPILGADPLRIAAVRADPKAWLHLLDLEEEVGRRPERWTHAAAVLVAAHAPFSNRMIK